MKDWVNALRLHDWSLRIICAYLESFRFLAFGFTTKVSYSGQLGPTFFQRFHNGLFVRRQALARPNYGLLAFNQNKTGPASKILELTFNLNGTSFFWTFT